MNSTWGSVRSVRKRSKYSRTVATWPYSVHGSTSVNEFSSILIPPENTSKVTITVMSSVQCSRCFVVEFILIAGVWCVECGV